jgi:CRP-like cAMP-binding protein
MHKGLLNYINSFTPLSNKDWNLLEPHLFTRTLKKNSLFTKEGKVCKEIGFVLSGNLRHYYTHDGEEKTTYFYFENNFVSDYISCISQQPGLLTIEALTDVELIVFPYTKLQDCYLLSKEWERFGRLIAEYLAKGLEERMVSLLTLNAEERYLELLKSNKQKIIERIPQLHIANYLGITPVSLSRIRNKINKG